MTGQKAENIYWHQGTIARAEKALYRQRFSLNGVITEL